MKKRIFCLLLSVFMLVGSLSILTACGGGGGGGDDDDPCANGHTLPTDDGDGKCTVCGEKITKHQHVDNNKSGKCDVCSTPIKDGDHTECADGDGDGFCDECGDPVDSTAWVSGPVIWENDDPIDIFFMMTHNSSGEQMPSACYRYLAGEDTSAKGDIDDMVSIRNTDAELNANVNLKYDYYDDVAEFGWSKCIEIMFQNVKVGAAGSPDIYCNFAYDMIGTSLKGTFHNLKNTELKYGNYFQFLRDDYDASVNDRGYMYEYMESVTLSLDKMYILASDYFLDLIRAFYVIPVNVTLLESVGMSITGDLNDDGKFSIDDFYEEVQQKKWTYNKVAAYSSAVYKNTGTSNDAEDIEDVLGFALTLGFQSSGIIYSTDITVIEKTWNSKKNDYDYVYPANSEKLYTLFDNIGTLVRSTGVTVIRSDPNLSKYGASAPLAIRQRFCDNKILFGNIIMLGSLEYDAYQKLKDAGGFGVVPVPLYHEVDMDSDENYLTSIHNEARPGGIARSTKVFGACTAFLDYQSTFSTDILNEYYDYNLQYNVVDGNVAGTVEMLKYIRNNVRSAFDKTFEDAIGVYNAKESIRWSYILEVNDFDYDIRKDYVSLRQEKQGYLEQLYNEYPKLP